MSASQLIYVCPTTDLQVYDPAKRDFLPADGREVERNTYWDRRISDADVVIKSTVKSTGKKKDA